MIDWLQEISPFDMSAYFQRLGQLRRGAGSVTGYHESPGGLDCEVRARTLRNAGTTIRHLRPAQRALISTISELIPDHSGGTCNPLRRLRHGARIGVDRINDVSPCAYPANP